MTIKRRLSTAKSNGKFTENQTKMENLAGKLAKLELGHPVFLHIKVIPKSSKNELVGLMADGETIKIKITDAPEKGKANLKLIKFLGKELKLKPHQIRIKSGEQNSLKILEIEPL